MFLPLASRKRFLSGMQEINAKAVSVLENKVQEKSIPDEDSAVVTESQAEKIVHVDNGEAPTVEEEIPVPEVVDEVSDSSQLAVESSAKIEELPKKSYASIVLALKQNGVPFSSPAPARRKPQPKKQEQHANKALTTTVDAEPIASRVDAPENDIPEEKASQGYSVYIKGLPMSATSAVVEEEFKKFGTIKPNGIQVRSNRVCIDSFSVLFQCLFYPTKSYKTATRIFFWFRRI